MGSEDGLVEIHPSELSFLFELKKRSSCCINLVNKSDSHVAFKVKTTSPKRYCVRPNVGVILPRSSREFIVTMQEQKIAPPDLQIKDKFLVQTTVVPFGITDEDIVPAFFIKDNGRDIEETKLRVVLVSGTEPQEEQPIIGIPHAKATVKVPVAEEMLINMNEVPDAVNEVHYPLLGETPAILSEAPSLVKESPTILRDFPVPSKEATFTLTKHAPSLKETPAVSVGSQFSSTDSSVTLKIPSKEVPFTLKEYAPSLKEAPAVSVGSQLSSTDSNAILKVPSKEAPFKLTEYAPSLKEAPAVSVGSQFSSTDSNAVLKVPSKEAPFTLTEYTPSLKEAPAVSIESQLSSTDPSATLKVPSKETSFTLTEYAPSLKEAPAVSVKSQYSLTDQSATLKESPPLEDTPVPREFAILSGDKGPANAENLHLSYITEEVQDLQLMLNTLETKLEEAETLIVKLRKETRTTIQERDKLRKDTALLKGLGTTQRQAGFPLLFVVYIAFVGMSLGYLLHL